MKFCFVFVQTGKCHSYGPDWTGQGPVRRLRQSEDLGTGMSTIFSSQLFCKNLKILGATLFLMSYLAYMTDLINKTNQVVFNAYCREKNTLTLFLIYKVFVSQRSLI